MDPWLEIFIAEHAPRCPVCRGSLSRERPECTRCGDSVRLGLKVTEAYLLAWGTSVVASALMAGCGLFLLTLILRRPQILERGEMLKAVMIAACGIGVLAAIAEISLVWGRRLFCRLPRWAQCVIAAGVLGLLIVDITSLVLVM